MDRPLAPELLRPLIAFVATAVLCFMTCAPALADGKVVYQVQAGDTLYGIARQFGVSPDLIAASNGLADPNVLAVGQTLTIDVPTATYVGGNVQASPATNAAPILTHLAVIAAPFFSQIDGGEYGSSNCGPTALSMALGALGIAADQMQLRHWADVEMGTNDPNEGTSWESLAYAARQFGAAGTGMYGDVGYHSWSVDDLKAEFAQGHPVVLLVRYWDLPDHTTSSYPGDHYIVALGFDQNDNVVYNDPIYLDSSGSHRLISQQHLDTAWTDTWAGLVRTAMAVRP